MSIITGTKDNFEKLLKENKKVLVDFNADWCGPCQMLKPTIEELADEKEDIQIVSVNVDDEDILSGEYNISSIPCLVLFKDGKETKRSVGLVPKDEILEMIGE